MGLNMKPTIVFFLCTVAAFAEAFQYPNNDSDEFCNCRPLSQCSAVVSKLKSSYNDFIKHRAFTVYLDMINCGYNLYEPQICCPNEIPNEVIKIMDNTKYWFQPKVENSVQQLKSAYSKVKISSVSQQTFNPMPSLNGVDSPNIDGQFPGCGKFLWREDFYGNSTEIGEYPWLALLEYDTYGNGKKLLCGGVLISDQHILTAARCVTSGSNRLTSVILGEHNTDANPECIFESDGQELFCVDSVKRYDIEYSIVHEKYNDGISHRNIMDDGFGPELHDIALIKIKQKVQFTNYIQPICLPLKEPGSRRYKVSGWGQSLVPNNKGFNTKLFSYLSRCERSDYERHELVQIYDENEHICAGGSNKRREQPCIVDSGGPLMAVEKKEDGNGRMTVFGVSYMEMTCDNRGQPKDLPGIFTNVYNYKNWIVEHMKL